MRYQNKLEYDYEGTREKELTAKATVDHDLNLMDVPVGKLKEVIVNEKPSIPTKEFIVYFKFDKDLIRKQYADTLDQVAAMMKAFPDLICDLTGHTDQYGTNGYNDDLSSRRVVNVRDYLIKAGIPTERILIGSFGETKLVKMYIDKDKAEINRRVEVTLRLAN